MKHLKIFIQILSILTIASSHPTLIKTQSPSMYMVVNLPRPTLRSNHFSLNILPTRICPSPTDEKISLAPWSLPSNMADLSRKNRKHYRKMSKGDFSQEFYEISADYGYHYPHNRQILELYILYQFEGFRDYIKTLSYYEDFIIETTQKIKESKSFSQDLKYIQGFKRLNQWFLNEANSIGSERGRKLWQQKVTEKKEIDQKRTFRIKQQKEVLYRQAHQVKTNQTKSTDAIERCEIELIRHLEREIDQIVNNAANKEQFAELAYLSKQFLSQAEGLLQAGENDTYICSIVRAQKVLETLKNPISQAANCPLAYDARDLLTFAGLNPESFKTFHGNQIQCHLHQEIVDTLNKAADYTNHAADHNQMHYVHLILFPCAESARLCNKEGSLEKAFALQDFCAAFLNVGNRFLDALGETAHALHGLASQGVYTLQNGVYIATEGIARGTENFSISVQKFIDEIATNPSETVVDLTKAIGNASLALGKVLLLATTNPKTFYQKGTHVLCNLANCISTMPKRELAVNSIAFATEWLISGIFGNLVFTKAGEATRILHKCSKYVFSELYTAVSLAKGNQRIRRLLSPMSTLIAEAVETAQLSTKYGIETVRATLKIFNTHPLLIPERAYFKKLAKVFVKNKRILEKANLRHIFCGEKIKGKLKGFHHAVSYPERIIKITKPKNKFGIYDAIWKYKGKTKSSCFFPDHWTRTKILKKICEASENVVEVIERGIRGITKEGIIIEIRFVEKPNKKTGEIIKFINTAYPIYQPT